MGRNSSGEMGCGASVSSRFTFENLALEGIFDRDQGPHALYQDINDVGKALLEHQYQHATQLTLSFQYCDSFSDLSGLGTGLASLTALQKLTLYFNGCDEQLSDVSAVGTALASLTALQELTLVFNGCKQLSDLSGLGTGLASLTALQELTLSFPHCKQLSDVSEVGTALASLTALQKMTLDFRGCLQLPDAITFQGFFSRLEYLHALTRC